MSLGHGRYDNPSPELLVSLLRRVRELEQLVDRLQRVNRTSLPTFTGTEAPDQIGQFFPGNNWINLDDDAIYYQTNNGTFRIKGTLQ